jgi:hypothetical protein
MAAGLPGSLEGGGFLIRLGREVVERLQERDRDFQELAALLSALVSQRSNSSVQSTIAVLV